jgi:uncharacterized membrane protein
MGFVSSLGVVLLFLLSIIIMAPPATAAMGLEVTVTLSKDSVNTSVTKTDGDALHFEGTVGIQKLQSSAQQVTVDLRVTLNANWNMTITPSSMGFSMNGYQTFNLMVFAPPGAKAGTKTLTVTAVARGLVQSDQDSAIADINVNQYYGLTLAVLSGESFNATPGEAVEGRLQVTNTGNGADTFAIEWLDPMELLNSCALQETLNVPPGTNSTVRFGMRIKEDVTFEEGKTYQISFKVTSKGAEEAGEVCVDQATVDLKLYPEEAEPEEEGSTTSSVDTEIDLTYIIVLVGVFIVMVAAVALVRRVRGHPEVTHEQIQT